MKMRHDFSHPCDQLFVLQHRSLKIIFFTRCLLIPTVLIPDEIGCCNCRKKYTSLPFKSLLTIKITLIYI